MRDIFRKVSSRKLWLAIAGVATGVALALGVDASELSTVAGAVTALLSVVTYIVTEGKVDTAAVKAAEQGEGEAEGGISGEG
jgi:phage shock protein PspC (stress-responsive transcriptional regulator)